MSDSHFLLPPQLSTVHVSPDVGQIGSPPHGDITLQIALQCRRHGHVQTSEEQC
jgi:hypothetical protein